MYEEDRIRKVSNWTIIKRLLGYLGREKRFLLVAVGLTILLIGIELLFPYLTKIAIDNYIISTVQLISPTDEEIEIISSFDKDALIRLNGDQFAVRSRVLSSIPSPVRQKLYSDGRLQREVYYIFRSKGDCALWRTLNYKEFGEFRLLAQNELNRLSKREILTLRRSDIEGIRDIAYIFLLFLVLHLVVSFCSIFALVYVGQLVMHRIRKSVFTHLQSLKLSFFDKTPSGRLVTRATNDIEKLNQFFTDALPGLFQGIFMCLGVMIVMFSHEPMLSLVCFTVLPFIVVAISFFRTRIRRVYRKARLLLARLNSKISESLAGIKVIQLFNQEKRITEDFRSVNQDYFKTGIQQVVTHGVFRPIVDILASVGLATVLWFGGREVIQNELSLGLLVAFISYINMFFRPVLDISERFNILEEALAGSERVFTFLDTKDVERNSGKVRKKRLEGKIEFRNVWHRYKEEWVLRGLNFTVHPRESVAIVGPTGAGKTSIIGLIPRFYEPERGEILIDDRPILDYDLNFLRQNIRCVMQEVFLFAGTIKDNIRLHNQNISDQDIKRVAEYVNLLRFIEKLPEMYETDAKERGTRFSGGERQLLAFARALATDPAVLILDEATSSVDSETESLIQDAIAKLLKRRTSIVIAHRLSTIKSVDRIFVIDKGRIVEEGRHDELLRKRGMYYSLYKLQYIK